MTQINLTPTLGNIVDFNEDGVIKDYAREEMQITFDIASRLVASQTLEISVLEKSEDAHLKICVGAKSLQVPPVVQLQKSQYIESIKNQVQVTSTMVETSQKFFMELAFDLLKRSWVLQERTWSPIKGILFVIYGFVHDGSRLPEVGEADIWRLTLSSDANEREGFDVICNHGTPLVTVLNLIPYDNSTGVQWGNPLVGTSSSSVIQKLQSARNTIFEKDLFSQILNEITQNERLFKKCVITSKKIVIPLIDGSFLQATLEKVDELQTANPISPDRNSYVQILARILLREIHAQNLTEISTRKPSLKLTGRLINYLEVLNLGRKVIKFFSIVEATLSKCCDTFFTRTVNEWTIKATLTGGKEMFIYCRITDSGQLYYSSSHTQLLELFSVVYLEELVVSLVIKYLFEIAVEEANCLFGSIVICGSYSMKVNDRVITVSGRKVSDLSIKLECANVKREQRISDMSESLVVELVKLLLYSPAMENTIKELMKMENFKSKDYSPKELVEAANKKIVTELKGIAFDPKPFIRSFEALTEELLRLKRKLQNKIEDQEDQLTASDNSKRKAFSEFNETFDEVNRSFEYLNSRLSEVGNTAIRIGYAWLITGEQLETIDKHRTRASESKDIIQYFLEFNKGSFSRLDALRMESPEGERKTAIIARRLNTIAKEIDIGGIDNARANIEKYCENFEKSLLQKFDQVYSSADRDTMNHIAKTLIDFNGGNSCIQTYVNQHAFFINILKLAETDTENLGETTWENQKISALQRLYDEIRQAVSSEWDVIYDVFPNAINVMQVFVQRIFAQSIQNFLEVLMQEASFKSSQIYLEVLTKSHKETSELVTDLHLFDETYILPLTGSLALVSILDRSFEDLYVPYINDEKYMKIEKAWLGESFSLALEPFESKLETGQKAKNAGKSNSKQAATPKESNVFVSSLFNTVSTMTSEIKQQLATPTSNQAPATDDAKPVPTISTCLKCIESNLISMERTKELFDEIELAESISVLFKLFLERIGERYVFISLDSAIEEISSQDAKSQPEIGLFSIVKVANEIAQLVNLHYQNCEGLVMKNSLTIHRDLNLTKNDFCSNIENKINSIMQKQLAVNLNWIEGILAKQKKTDYNMKDGLLGNTIPTQTSNQIIEFLRRVSAEAFEFLDEANRDLYLTEIGTSLCNDITRYHEVVIQFRVENLDEYFNVLKELCNLYIVKPENLRMVLQEGYLGRMELPVLHSYISLRADWSKLGKLEKDLFYTTQ
ncbi:Exocyst complex component 5 [Boothiomyces sp. JEL0866]|nr:Exocyst complex component 5 [Boothiomyces sp. JEL0866]